jgi:signal transduction histidine kinase
VRAVYGWTLRRAARGGSGDAVVIRVSDSGDGIPPGHEEHVFQRHVSLHGGTGLGLPVARALIEREGGRLRLANARPVVFELCLPSAISAV